MSHLVRLVVVLLFALPFAPATVRGEEEIHELWIERAEVSRKGKIKIVCLIPPRSVTSSYHPERDGLERSLGSETLLSLPPVGDRANQREKRHHRAVYREKRSTDRASRCRFKLQLEKKKFVFQRQGGDTSALFEDAGSPIPVTLRLGSAVFATTLDLETRGKSLTYRAPIQIPFFTPYRGGVVTGFFEGDPVPYRVIYDGARRGCLDDWSRILIRDQERLESAWLVTHGCNRGISTELPAIRPTPAVNFGEELVFAARPSYNAQGLFVGARILSVTASGTGVTIRWEELEVPDGVAPGTWPFTQWALFIAIPDLGGPVTLIRTERRLTEWEPLK